MGIGLIQLLAQHRVASNLAMIMMILAGFWAIKNIPSQLDPPARFPMVFVEIQWLGASAEDVEQLITLPIEQQLRTINELQNLSSYTANGFVNIRARFNFDADMTIALDTVKQRVANIRNLPADIEPPRIRRAIDLEPVASLLITGDGTLSELIPIVRDMETELLARGIEGVTYDGLPSEEIALLIGGKRLHELRMTLDELAVEVARVSQNVPAGSIGRSQGSRQLRSLDQKRGVPEFESLTIQSGDQLIRLGNVGEIVRRPRDGQPRVTSQGKPAIEMMLWRATADDAFLADRILDGWLADTTPTLPIGVEVAITSDVSKLLADQLDMVVKNAASGTILVILTLFLFLNGRVGWWVMVGIPVSFLGALALFYGVFDQGISIIGLIAFIMALGIVVDDAIVVGEQAATEFESGKPPLQAAVDGARRMWVPVATSSMTTMAAFIPLIIVGGEMGDAVLTLPIALLCIILASLMECFAVLPGHLKATLEHMKPPKPTSFRVRFDTAFQRLRDERFKPLVDRALDYPGATVCAALGGVICAFSLIASGHLGVNMVTGFQFESLEANVEFAGVATDRDKQGFMDHLEQTLQETNVEAGEANVPGWVRKENLAEFDNQNQTGMQYASIQTQYAFEETRTVAPQAFADQWREKIVRPPYVEQFWLGVEGGQNGGQPDIGLVLRGKDLPSLKTGAEELSSALAGYPGVSNVTDNLPYGKEQLIFELTATGRALGLTPESVGRQLRSAYTGRRIQIFNEAQSELEVRVMLPDVERDDLGQLQRFPIRTPSGDFVPLSNVASFHQRRGIDVIRHDQMEMAVTISADVDPEVANAIAIVGDVEDNVLPDILARLDLTFGLGGSSERDKMIIEILQLGGMLTLVLIYLILAWVFASYLWPLAIMTAIPFGMTGAIFGHWITGFEIGTMSLLAFFSLTGIVVNDSIVLISFFKQNFEAGQPLKKALTAAVVSRFRAVILTSLTTIAGLTPLIFERSSLDFYVAPIAITLCFGLAFSTLLVLLVIPALIVLLEGSKSRLGALATTAIARARSAGSNLARPPSMAPDKDAGAPHE